MVIRPGHSIARPWPRSGHNFRLDQNGWGGGSMGFRVGCGVFGVRVMAPVRSSAARAALDLLGDITLKAGTWQP